MIENSESKGILKSVILMLTNACNLRCDYCFEYEHPVRHMSKETALQTVRWFLSNVDKRAVFTLFGGEPLLRKEIIPWFLDTAVTEAQRVEKKADFSITTNGTLLDPDIGDVLKKYKVHIQLSADGNAKGQNIHRKYASGEGSFQQVESVIPLIKEVCPRASVRMTITPGNVHTMAEGVEYFVEHGFNDIHPVPMIEGDWTPETREVFAQNLEEVSALFIGHFIEGRFLKIHGLTDIIQRASGKPKAHLCGAGRALVAVDTDGAIFPCQRFLGYTNSGPRWVMGDIFKGFVKEKLDYFNDLTADKVKSCLIKKDESGQLCRECEIYKICAGGCPAINDLETGDPMVASSGYTAFKTISIDEAHGLIKYLEEKHPDVWKKYIERLSNNHGHKNPR